MRLPIKKGLLSILLMQMDTHYMKLNQPYLRILYKAVFSTMYFGLLRISEVSDAGHPVLACDVHIGMNKRKFMFILRTSKTHGKNMKPQIMKISAKNKSHSDKFGLPCPFEMLREYASYRGPF